MTLTPTASPALRLGVLRRRGPPRRRRRGARPRRAAQAHGPESTRPSVTTNTKGTQPGRGAWLAASPRFTVTRRAPLSHAWQCAAALRLALGGAPPALLLFFAGGHAPDPRLRQVRPPLGLVGGWMDGRRVGRWAHRWARVRPHRAQALRARARERPHRSRRASLFFR